DRRRSAEISLCPIRKGWQSWGLMLPRVLVVLDTSAAWSRGILRGLAGMAHARGWELLHYHPEVDLGWAVSVETAKQLLSSSNLALPEVASRSGFTTPALLNEAFRRARRGSPPANTVARPKGSS